MMDTAILLFLKYSWITGQWLYWWILRTGEDYDALWYNACVYPGRDIAER